MMKKLLLAALLWLASPDLALAAIAKDGSGCTSTTPGGNSITCTITTTSANDVILVIPGAINATGPVNVTDTAGLTYTYVTGSKNWNATVGQSLEFWYAIAPAPLTSNVVTVTYTSSGASRVTAMAISGADTSNPFDANASIPAQAVSATTVTSLSATPVSTNSSNLMLVSSVRTKVGSQTFTQPSGYTNLFTASANNTAYRAVSAALSGATITYGWTSASEAVMVFTAIKEAPTPPSSDDPGLLMTIGM